MNEDQRILPSSRPSPIGRAAPELPIRLVPFQGLVPESLAPFFERQTPWTWRDLRTVFCRHPQTRRLVNVIRTIDLILEKAPYTLAKGHWSIAGYREALEKFESAIARLGQLAGLVAGDARVRLPLVPDRRETVPHRRETPGPRFPRNTFIPPGRPVGLSGTPTHEKRIGGSRTATGLPQAA